MTEFEGHDTGRVLQPLLGCSSNASNTNGLSTAPAIPDTTSMAARRSRRRSTCAEESFAQWMSDNQIGFSFNLLALLCLAHLIPRARPYTTKFLTLSYHDPTSGKYRNGIDDVYLIASFIVLFTWLRAGVMKYILAPFAKLCGVHKENNMIRFSEQSWLLCYYAVFWTMGMYIYITSDYWLNMKELWTNWPQRELDGLAKFYILGQWAFWLQQIIVINMEKRRKDYWQTLSHHLVTCCLIYACYAYHQTRVGNVILVTMDFIDIVLPLAKCLKYLGFKTLCDVMFGVFLVSWIATRHVFYSIVCWSIFADIPEIIGETCWKGSSSTLQGPLPTPEGYRYLLEPFLDSKGIVCFGQVPKWSFLTPLLLLQCMNCIWLVMIARVALKVLRKEGAEDSRSDDEGGKDDEFAVEDDCSSTEELLPEKIGSTSFEPPFDGKDEVLALINGRHSPKKGSNGRVKNT
ncbi:hypothetical protein FZEAL_6940 [Fusarium zealandicum]|uniref:TLC domain-containing protein n=1 Tax=Fusarium zealandicum TaxID=1053134 RepID=A0A8H4UGR5_9HYPO|nr:hypothetical protein FZEAL_6940 [Fusarium zealandicum]